MGLFSKQREWLLMVGREAYLREEETVRVYSFEEIGVIWV